MKLTDRLKAFHCTPSLSALDDKLQLQRYENDRRSFYAYHRLRQATSSYQKLPVVSTDTVEAKLENGSSPWPSLLFLFYSRWPSLRLIRNPAMCFCACPEWL